MAKKKETKPGLFGIIDEDGGLRLLSALASADRVLRKTSDPWAALRVLGLVADKRGKEAVGRRGRSIGERALLADLFERLMGIDGPPYRQVFTRLPDRLDLFHRLLADLARAAKDGAAFPPVRDDLFFHPDAVVPMDAEAALRNVARYMGGRSRAQTWKVLNDESRRRQEAGLPPLALPKKVVPADPRWDGFSTD